MAASRSEELVPRRATYQDVLDAPAHLIAEIIDGTLHTHSRPAVPHTRASSVLGRKIGTPYDDDTTGPDGWWILDEPELHLRHEILVPDLAGCRREHRRMARRARDRILEAFELRDGEWVLVSIRPFDAIAFSLGDLWP